jgi:glycosyltransferase involved in cell wall biosynthesis
MNKILVICPIYNRFPQILPSLINQTHTNWELLLVHDGQNTSNLKGLIDLIGDPRIKYWETKERQGNWGHYIRRDCIRNIDSYEGDFVLVTNDDNYLAPIFFEEMLKGFSDPSIKATFCSQFVHSYDAGYPDGIYKYGVITTKLELGYVDCTCVIMRREICKESGWEDMDPYSDWTYFNRVIEKYGEQSFNKVMGCLVVHG